MKKNSLKLLVISYLLLVVVNTSFAQTYPATCPAEAQAIVNAVGGCSAVDKDQYSAVYDSCCAVSSEPISKMKMALWTAVVIAVLGLAIFGARYYLHTRKKV